MGHLDGRRLDGLGLERVELLLERRPGERGRTRSRSPRRGRRGRSRWRRPPRRLGSSSAWGAARAWRSRRQDSATRISTAGSGMTDGFRARAARRRRPERAGAGGSSTGALQRLHGLGFEGLEGQREALDALHVRRRRRGREHLGRQPPHDLVQREDYAALGKPVTHGGLVHRQGMTGKLIRHLVPAHRDGAIRELGHHEAGGHQQMSGLEQVRAEPVRRKW